MKAEHRALCKGANDLPWGREASGLLPGWEGITDSGSVPGTSNSSCGMSMEGPEHLSAPLLGMLFQGWRPEGFILLHHRAQQAAVCKSQLQGKRRQAGESIRRDALLLYVGASHSLSCSAASLGDKQSPGLHYFMFSQGISL